MKLITKPQVTSEAIAVPEYAPRSLLDRFLLRKPIEISCTFYAGPPIISKFVLQTDTPINIKVRCKKQYLEIDNFKLYGILFLEELNGRDNMYLCSCDAIEQLITEEI